MLPEEIRDFFQFLHLSEFGRVLTLTVLALAAGLISVFYKENFFGFGDFVRRILRAGSKSAMTEIAVSSGIRPAEATSVQADVPAELIVSNPVRFETVQKPRIMELLKVVQMVRERLNGRGQFRIPLEFDPRISDLVARIEYEHRTFPTARQKAELSEETLTGEFSSMTGTLREAERFFREFPNKLDAAAARLFDPSLHFIDTDVMNVCKFVIELEMVSLIAILSKWQPDDPKSILTEYARVRQKHEIVGMAMNLPVEKLVSYRILLAGEARERVVLAPRDYGGEYLLVKKEFEHAKESRYVPPKSFLVEYLFPQMIWANDNADDWQITYFVESVFVKDLEGSYLSYLEL